MTKNNHGENYTNLIQKIVRSLCLHHFSRHLGLTEPAESTYKEVLDSQEQVKTENHPNTDTVFFTFLFLITA